jgi:hypothetical protein
MDGQGHLIEYILIRYDSKGGEWGGKGYGVKRHFHQYFRYIVAVSFIGGGKLE